MRNSLQVVVNIDAGKDEIAIAKAALELSQCEFDLVDAWISGSSNGAYLVSLELETTEEIQTFEEKHAVSLVELLEEK
mgnify:CR=1 FL=1